MTQTATHPFIVRRGDATGRWELYNPESRSQLTRTYKTEAGAYAAALRSHDVWEQLDAEQRKDYTAHVQDI